MRRVFSLLFMMLVMLCITDNVYAQGGIVRPGHATAPGGSRPPVKPRLTVNGESKELDITFPDTGGEQTLTISTNQATPKAESLPSWITVTESTKKQMTINCEENTSSYSRSDFFVVKAGKLSVQVFVSQPAGKPDITKIEFANTKRNGDIINNYGATLYASDMRYLTPRLTYNGPGTSKNKTLFVKIFNPDGTLRSGETSPFGFTYKIDVTFFPGIGNKVQLMGWGNESNSNYGIGTHKIEIYCDGSRLYSGSVMLDRKPGESTYLKVGNQTKLSYNFGAKGSSKTFHVSSDCTGWHLAGVPSFCKVTNQTSTSFTLECNENLSTKPRSDYMFVRTDNQSVRVDITQSAGTGAKINKVWVDHNVYENGEKGMRIHVRFETDGLKGHLLNVCAFFHYKDGRKLEGYSGSGYCTTDGQATVQNSATATYENSLWSDYKLFIPNSKLGTNRTGSVGLKFDVQILDKTTGKLVAESEYYHFSFM